MKIPTTSIFYHFVTHARKYIILFCHCCCYNKSQLNWLPYYSNRDSKKQKQIGTKFGPDNQSINEERGGMLSINRTARLGFVLFEILFNTLYRIYNSVMFGTVHTPKKHCTKKLLLYLNYNLDFVVICFRFVCCLFFKFSLLFLEFFLVTFNFRSIINHFRFVFVRLCL